MGETKKKVVARNIFLVQQATAVSRSDTEHLSPTAATMTGWDTSCDSEPYFDSMQTTGRVSCTCHVMPPTNRCTQSCRFCCCRAQGFLSHIHVYDKQNVSIALQIVMDLLLLRWSQTGAPPVASAAPRNTRSLLGWLHISNEKQIVDTSTVYDTR